LNPLKLILIIIIVPAILYAGYTLFTKVIDKNDTGTFDRTICWNYGRVTAASAYWKNGCGGVRATPGITCTRVLLAMTQDEITEWKKWEQAGKPSIEGCY
jgi:hypothetical protein